MPISDKIKYEISNCHASPFALAFLPHLREIFLYQNEMEECDSQ